MRKSYIAAHIWATALTFLLALAPLPVSAQNVELTPGKSTGRTHIRAVAVVEFTGEEPMSGKFRVVPVSVFRNGDFIDGEIYLADPVPLALRDDTIYELQESGKPVGYITVKGQAHTASAVMKRDEDGAADEEDAADLYGMGILQKSAPDVQMASAAPAKIVLPEEHRFDDVHAKDPKKRRRDRDKDKDKTADKDKGQDKSSTADKSKPPVQIATMPPASLESDPDRPTLSHAAHKEVTIMPESVALNGDVRAMVAVSDPTNKDARPYRYDFTPAEEQKYRARMIALAYQEAAQQAKARGRAVPAATKWQDVQVRAFNLSLDNTATLILTATLPGGDTTAEHPVMKHAARTRKTEQLKVAQQQELPKIAPEQYVTLVARINLEDEVRKTFFELTDRDRFDIAPRLTLVDAVDADGDGRGELLFREHTDQGLAWGIYRAGPDTMTKLYDSAE